MNIIISSDLHNKLQKHIVSTIEFGSALKGESTSTSDKDLLHIVKSADWWVSSSVANQHLLQYKTENEDHIYCTAHTFIKSLLDGDSTIFLEMHKYGGLNNTCLEFLNKYDFVFYRSLRAYLGISRRDIKDIGKLWKNKDTLMRKINKKLKFTQQGIDFVVDHLREKCSHLDDFDSFISDYEHHKAFILDNKYSIVSKGEKVIVLNEKTKYDDFKTISDEYIALITFVREKLTTYIEKKYLEKTFDKDTFLSLMKDLNDEVEVVNTMRECEHEVMTHFYNSYIGEI